MSTITAEESGAFIERFKVPPTRSGQLDGLTFAVKDLIDVAGYHTGCGNPTWLATHPPATMHAICVEQLLAAGARCEGKTITDEIAFSLLGENHFYGTPLNPRAPDRVPGGSSSGSASAVACGLVDFALGTDTGGSVRVPASNCGIWGLRPSHGRISVAGVMPFSPTLDTVGLFAREAKVLERVAGVLLPSTNVASTSETSPTVHLLRDVFALADDAVQNALAPAIELLRRAFDGRVQETSLAELCCDDRPADMTTWLTAYRVLQGTEILSSLGDWITTSGAQFGPAPTAGLEYVRKIDRTRIGESIEIREHFSRRLNAALAGGSLICLPTAPTIAPRKGSKAYDRTEDYYFRALSTTAVAGVARLPQVSMPLADVGGVPIGLSLAGAWGTDRRLLTMAKKAAEP